MRVCLLSMLAATCLLLGGTLVQAQPLVTGGLSLYYSFDAVDEDGLWADGSGNGLPGLTTLGLTDANEDGKDDIRLDTADKKRGAGSVWFETDAATKEDYVAVCDPVGGYQEGCDKATANNLIPTRALTVAAWVKVEEVGMDHSIWQSRADGGGFTHTQIQGNGNTRMTLRGDLNSDTIVNFNEPPGGNPVTFGEWVHWVGTYEKGADPGSLGDWDFYLNGENVAGGEGNGPVAGTETDMLGNWGQGAFIGLVPDFNRQLVGRMDEFYLFNRKVTDAEVKTLFELKSTAVPGDFDGDGSLTTADINALSTAVRAGNNPAQFDLNADNVVNGADRTVWVNDLKKTYFGDANLDREFNSGDFVAVFTVGKYESGGAAEWQEGDWNGDGKFDSGDFVTAFTEGGYEKGPHPAVSAVPEPAAFALFGLSLIALLGYRGRR